MVQRRGAGGRAARRAEVGEHVGVVGIGGRGVRDRAEAAVLIGKGWWPHGEGGMGGQGGLEIEVGRPHPSSPPSSPPHGGVSVAFHRWLGAEFRGVKEG